MKKSAEKEILNILRNIEQEQHRENRYDRVKALERDNQLLRGYIERIEEKQKAVEHYLKVEYVRESAYKLRK